ncbi:MAG: helix-turn-helix transcriptional regulator [Candidatus Zixiibacteriota bacterium]
MGQRDKFDPLYRRLVQTLIQVRKDRGLTQTDVAMRMGTDQSHLSKFERFERRLDVVDFIRLCEALGQDAPELLRTLLKADSD